MPVPKNSKQVKQFLGLVGYLFYLQEAPILRYPDPAASYTLYTDASKYAYAGVLTQ